MAKSNPQSNERSRVRVIVVDFDGSSNDLHQLAGAIANAVKPPQPVVLTLPAPAAQPALTHRLNGEQPGLFDQHADAGEIEHVQSDAEPVAIKPTDGARKKRRLRTPVAIDLDLTTGPKPFKEYFEEMAPKSDSRRYLVIAQWLKEYRSIAEIGADHVYTCYRFVGMSVPEDLLRVFRGLKKQAWVDSGSGPGLFKINHIGENHLTKNKE